MLPLLLALLVTDWPQWRGPAFNGSTDAGSLPVEWSTTENVAWKCDLPGPGSSTPVVVGDFVFLTAVDRVDNTLVALALDRVEGEILWAVPMGAGGRLPENLPRGRENTMAAPSPVTDGEHVAFLFGTGELLMCDVEGEELWRRNIFPPSGQVVINWGYASSPLLWKGKLYVEVLHRGESYVLALDPDSGKELWRHVRPNEARAESQEAYTTPIPFTNRYGDEEREELLILGGDCLSGHDPESGEERWRWCGINPRKAPNFRHVSSAVTGDDGLVVVTTPQHGPMHGLRVRGTQVEELWTLQRPTPDSTTPLLYQGRLFAVDGRNQRLVCLEPQSGKLLYQGELETDAFLRASPTGADGKVYVIDAEGHVVVLDAAAETLTVLARNKMDSYPSRSTISASAGRLYVRTADALYCVGGD